MLKRQSGFLGHAGRTDRRYSLPRGVGSHVDQRMAFGQDWRTALALGGSAIRCGIER